MSLRVRITDSNGQAREIEVEPGATVTVAGGDTVEIIDTGGPLPRFTTSPPDVIVTLSPGTPNQAP